MVFLTNTNNELKKNIFFDIQNADDVILIAPFLTGGLVEKLLEKCKRSSFFLIVALEYPTDPDRIQDIRKAMNHNNIRYIPGENKYLHSKLYILKGKKNIVYIGSANLTDAGFSGNIETMARLTLSSNSSEWKSIEDFVNGLKEKSVLIDDGVLRKYKAEYNHRKKAWNDKRIKNAASRKDDHILEKSKYHSFCSHIKNKIEPRYKEIVGFEVYEELPIPHHIDRFLEWIYTVNHDDKKIQVEDLKEIKGEAARINRIERNLVGFRKELESNDSKQLYYMGNVAKSIKTIRSLLSSNVKINKLNKADFEAKIIRSLHCTHYHGISEKIVGNDLRHIKRTLKYLNDNYQEQTIDTLRRNVVGSSSEYYLEGLGPSGFSELMSFWHPDEQYIMNSKSVYSMKYLGFIF